MPRLKRDHVSYLHTPHAYGGFKRVFESPIEVSRDTCMYMCVSVYVYTPLPRELPTKDNSPGDIKEFLGHPLIVADPDK